MPGSSGYNRGRQRSMMRKFFGSGKTSTRRVSTARRQGIARFASQQRARLGQRRRNFSGRAKRVGTPVPYGGYNGALQGTARPLRSSGSRGYILKKYGGSLPKDKKLYSLYADNTLNWSYVDQASTSETTTAAAKQIMWGTRVSAAGRNGSTIVPTFNLMVHDPVLLGQIVRGYPTVEPTTPSYKTTKIVVKNYECSAALTNIENGPIEVWEYRLIARARLGIGNWSAILSTLDDSYNSSTTGAGSVGSTATNVIGGSAFDNMTASTTAAGSSTIQTNIGVTPYQLAALTKWFKISKVTKKLMNPNDRWEIKYSCHKPMIYDNERWNFGTEPSRDGSVSPNGANLWTGQGFSLFVLKGTWAANSDGAADQKFGIGNGAVGIEYRHRIHYALLASNVSNHQIIQDAAGFTRGEAGYMGPVVRNLNLNAISTGPVPAAAGVDVNGPAGLGLEDEIMQNDD